MSYRKKRIDTKGKADNAYISKIMLRVIDDERKELDKILQKEYKLKRKVSNVVASEILAEILKREPKILKKHKDIINKYIKNGRK